MFVSKNKNNERYMLTLNDEIKITFFQYNVLVFNIYKS